MTQREAKRLLEQIDLGHYGEDALLPSELKSLFARRLLRRVSPGVVAVTERGHALIKGE